MNKKPDARIDHPDFGYVEFTSLTPRQKDILMHYIKLRDDANNKKTKVTRSKRRTN